MDAIKLSIIVSLLIALSIASERLVEIIKGLIPALNLENSNPVKEGWRRCILQLMAVGSGIFTVFIARDEIPVEIYDVTNTWGFLSLGLLASGGSGFWNSILTYLGKVKDLKSMDVEQKKNEVSVNIKNIPGNP